MSKSQDGEVQQIGSPMELFHKPANRFVAGFLGSPSMNFVKVKVVAHDNDSITVSSEVIDEVALPRRDRNVVVGDTLELGIRPQYLEPHHYEVKGSMYGRVSLSERLSTETVLDITLADGNKVIASISEDKVFEINEEISLCFDIEKVHIF